MFKCPNCGQQGVVLEYNPQEKKKGDDWYNMTLGLKIWPNDSSSILRVPGGWVYSNTQGCCFVPYHSQGENNE